MKYRRILIVDDSATSRLIVKRCFEIAGYADATFLEAGDGAAALDLLRFERVDLVVTDLKMPRIDGHTLVKKLRSTAETKTLPVVVISSVAAASDDEPLFQENVAAIIQKPLSPAKLIHALNEEQTHGSD